MHSAPSEWWRGCVIYEIYLRSFCDSNGDGVGDLRGVTQRLRYVRELGVDAIWITPFNRSPMRDFGYDVSDYKEVDPQVGTMQDFEALISHAHELGLKVLMDLVLNHTSDQHKWFIESKSSRTNRYAEYYVWQDANPDGTPPNNWLSVFGGSVWQWCSQRMQYFLHNFLSSQPDLNFHNRDVQLEVLNIVRFLLAKGVDGLRLDAVIYYFHSLKLETILPSSTAA